MDEAIIKKPKNNWWKRLVVGLIVVFVVVGAPIAGVFIAFYDDSSNSEYVDTNETSEQLFSRVVSSCLDDVATTEKIRFKLTENDFNQILIPAVNENIDETVGQFLNSFYLDITEDSYNFVFELKEEYLKIFKSKITIVTTMEHFPSENVEEDKFVFTMTDIVIGRVSGLLSFGKSLIKKFQLDTFISDFFVSAGLNVEMDIDNNVIVYKTVDLINDIIMMSGSQGGEFFEVFSSVVETCVYGHNFGFDFYSNETLELYLNLSQFGFNDIYCSEATENSGYFVDIEKHIEDLITLIENEIITFDDVGQLMHYLVHGYGKTTSANQNFVDGLDLNCIGITDPSLYEGDNLPETIQLNEVVGEQIRTKDFTDTTNRHLANVTEAMLNQMIGSTDVIGYSFLLPVDSKGEEVKIPFVVIDKFYTNIEDDILKAVARINMNGFNTYLILEYVVDETNTDFKKLVLKPNKTFLGKTDAPEDMLHYFYTVIGEGFNDLDGTTFDEDTGNITIDFSASFNSAGNLDYVLALGTPVISLIGEDLEDDGVISIDF